MSELWHELSGERERVDSALRQALSIHCGDSPPALVEAMAYSLLAPGKRLRPLLAIQACLANGGTFEQALPAACALEMVHTYSLVHDDLPAMDNDDLRRGLPTCHVKFGEALAILVGDALLTLAFQVLASGCPPRTAAVSCAELARGAGAVGMVGGQVLDLAAERRIGVNFEQVAGHPLSLEAIHNRKTGALFRSALRLGVFAATAEGPRGVNPDALELADRFALNFGLAFQITDDLLDVQSTTEKTGKAVGKDAARGKLTYPGTLGIEESRRRAVELAERAATAAESMGSCILARIAREVVARER